MILQHVSWKQKKIDLLFNGKDMKILLNQQSGKMFYSEN